MLAYPHRTLHLVLLTFRSIDVYVCVCFFGFLLLMLLKKLNSLDAAFSYLCQCQPPYGILLIHLKSLCCAAKYRATIEGKNPCPLCVCLFFSLVYFLRSSIRYKKKRTTDRDRKTEKKCLKSFMFYPSRPLFLQYKL